MTEEIKTYRKHNSFLELRHRDGGVTDVALGRIAVLRSHRKFQNAMDTAQVAVLQRVYTDLLDGGMPGKPRFALTPSVAVEICSLDDSLLPRYLVHRYRYEIYPQTKVVDDCPPCLQIEPSSVCNYRCVFCFETDKFFTHRSNGFMGHMTFDTFRRVVDQAEGHIEFITLASRGEPLLCPDIEAMLAYTCGKFLGLKMNTNASLLDERKAHAILQSGIKTLVFSIDATEEPLYSQLRVNGNLNTVLYSIEQFRKIRETQYRDSKIITRVSGVKFDERQNLNAMQRCLGELVDQVAFVNYNPWKNVYECASTGVNEPCSDLWRRMFVWWDGKINPCDVDYRSTLSVGSLSDGELSQLWRAPAYECLRADHLNGCRTDITICSHCVLI